MQGPTEEHLIVKWTPCLRANAQKYWGKRGHGQNLTNLCFEFIERYLWVFKGFGVHFSKYGLLSGIFLGKWISHSLWPKNGWINWHLKIALQKLYLRELDTNIKRRSFLHYIFVCFSVADDSCHCEKHILWWRFDNSRCKASFSL